jgi:dihydrodipicolinate synthase/N-acetylneuraminate lyase
MLKVTTRRNVDSVTAGRIFKENCYIIAIKDESGDIYKLSKVDFGEDAFAFVRLQGDVWFNGSNHNITGLIDDAINHFNRLDVFVFETIDEYIEWLSNN